MVRVPVPDDYDAGVITVAGTHDHLYGEADVNLSDRRHARHVKVREGEPGVVNVNANYAEAVADYLGVSVDGDSGASGGASDETATGSDADETDNTATDGGTCEAVKSDGEVCGRDLPCPYHSDDPEE